MLEKLIFVTLTARLTHPFGKRWLYLAIVVDLHSRKVVGWSVGASKTAALVKRALKLAVKKRKPAPRSCIQTEGLSMALFS